MFLGEELGAFEVVVLQMLEDVQERLVYRAQVRIIPLRFAFGFVDDVLVDRLVVSFAGYCIIP